MVFESSSTVSFVCDTLIIIFYFNNPGLFGDGRVHMLGLNSLFVLALLAGLRIVLFVPAIYYYQHDRPMISHYGRTWLAANSVYIVIKGVHDAVQEHGYLLVWLALAASVASVV